MILDRVRQTFGWPHSDRRHTLTVWLETSLKYPDEQTLRAWAGEVPDHCREAFEIGFGDLYGEDVWGYLDGERDPDRARYLLLGFLLKRAIVLRKPNK